jgi:S-adenosylmethionine:tRNA-ribosyltransferase-isomerase (queuine synthetase)
LAKGAHIVLNESRVVDARLFVNSIQGADQTEMMILDIGDIDINLPCKEIELNVMLRTQNVNVGDVFELIGGGNVEVVGIKGYVPIINSFTLPRCENNF